MLVMEQTANVKAKGKVRVLKLSRETLRELDAGDLKPPATRQCTKMCDSYAHCTRGCG
jgi:hypothetical protein